MKVLTSSSPGGKLRKRIGIGIATISALLLVLIGSLVFSAVSRRTPTVSASTIPGVYVSAGDGTLYKLDSSNGTAIWHIQNTDRNLPAAPAVANNVVYFGTLTGTLYAVNASTGHELWHRQTRGNIVSSPVVVGSVVYVGSADDFIYALNAQTGALLWRFDTGVGNEAVVPTSVSVANGVVYGSASDQVDHSYLFAIDASTGAQLWRVKMRDQQFTNVEYVNNVLYFASWAITHAGGPRTTDSYVYAYDARTGKRLWISSTIGDVILSAPEVSNNVLYVGSQDTYVYAFNAQTGALEWRHQLGGPIYAAPVIVNGALLVGVATNASTAAPGSTSDVTATSGSIVALDATTGNVIWQQPQINQYAGTPLAQQSNLVYVGTNDNEVYALDVTNGAIIWHYQMASANPFNNAPITVAP